MAAHHRFLRGQQDVRREPFQRGEIGGGAQQEDAAVPEAVAFLQVAGGHFQRGLFDEARDRQQVGRIGGHRLDIAVAGGGKRGHHAQRHHHPGRGHGAGLAHGLGEGGAVADQVIGGQHQQHRVGTAAARLQRSHGCRGRGIARMRLEHDGGQCAARLPRLFGHHETVRFIADQDGVLRTGNLPHPQQGVLQQRVLSEQAKELLGIAVTGQWPQPGASAATQDDWYDLLVVCHGMSPSRSTKPGSR